MEQKFIRMKLFLRMILVLDLLTVYHGLGQRNLEASRQQIYGGVDAGLGLAMGGMFGKEGASKRFSDDSGCGGQISGWQGSYFGSTTSLLLLLQPIKQKLKLILCADFL